MLSPYLLGIVLGEDRARTKVPQVLGTLGLFGQQLAYEIGVASLPGRLGQSGC